MDGQTESTDLSLEVGRAVIFQTGPRRADALRTKAFIRGWQSGAYILLEIPATKGPAPTLRENQECVLRFLTQGDVCGFSATILDLGKGAFTPYIRISWPTHVSTVRVRKQERVEVRVPCKLSDEEGTEADGEIQDISAGGCRLVSERPYQKNESLRISFSLPDGTTVEKGNIVVRNVTDTAEGACLGCQFDFEDESLSDDIEFFVATTLERIRGKTSAAPRILIFEKEPDGVLALQNTLLKEGYEVVVSGDLVDGFFLLRMTVPDVLLIRAGLVDPSGVQVCKMVKAKSRFKNLPVIVFGEDTPSIGDQAKEAGAAGYLPTIQNTGAVLEALAEHVTPPSGDESDEDEAAS